MIKYSECCWAKPMFETDLCSDCKEHTEFYTEDELHRKANMEVYESLSELAPEGFKGGAQYLSDGVWVYPDGTMKSEQI